MRQPGIEPGSIAWKATMLTFTPPTLDDGVTIYIYRQNTYPPNQIINSQKNKVGLVRDLNPGPLAPKARIIPLDQRAVV